jgi:hypothetical protein
MTTSKPQAKPSTGTGSVPVQAGIQVRGLIIGGKCGSKYCQVCGRQKV